MDECEDVYEDDDLSYLDWIEYKSLNEFDEDEFYYYDDEYEE